MWWLVVPTTRATEERQGWASTLAWQNGELTDEEVIAAWKTTIAGVGDGTLPTFSAAAALREDVRKRFGL